MIVLWGKMIDNTETLKLKKRKLNLKREKLFLKYRNIAWMRYHHLNTKNRNMTFKNREFLIDIYKAVNNVRRIAIMKSVQCGLTECFIVSHLEQAERGLSILYILPKIDIRNRFVNNRINGAIVKVALYREIINRTINKADSVALKVFGDGAINYVASNSVANFTEYPADAVYYDEKDRMDQDAILMAVDRLSDSEYKFERMVSNPTVAEYGISYDYENSTCGRYFFKCDHCGEWQPFDFFKNVVKEIGKREYKVLDEAWEEEGSRDVYIYCSKCGGKIDRFGVNRQWVHENRDADTVGFHISKVFSPQGTIRDLVNKMIKSKNSEYKFQLFLNSDLGLPMVGGGSQITRDEVVGSRHDYRLGANIKREGVRYAGVDVGNDLHVVVRDLLSSGKKKMIWKSKLKHEHEVLKLIRDFNISKLVIDAGPELRLVENLKKKSDRVYSCQFTSIRDISVNRQKKVVSLRRTLAIDRVKENYHRSIYMNPTDIADDDEYLKHMMSNVRVVDMSSGEFIWLQKSNRPDHYLLTEAYCDIAGELAAGTDIFSHYEEEAKMEDDYKHKVLANSKVTVVNEMDGLDNDERERIEKKKVMSTDEFFSQLRNEQMVDDVLDNIYGEEDY